jgi:hypothetical protein
MCNVRYEYTSKNIDESLLETAFEHAYFDNMGFCYKCKLCDAILKSALDAWLHMKNYHNIKTLNDYKAHEELKKSLDEATKEQQEQNDKQNNKIIIKKVVKPRPKTILDFLRGDNK